MAEPHLQAFLYRKRNIIKQEIEPLRFDQKQKEYIRSFLSIHKKTLKYIFGLIFLITLLEVSIPLITNLYIKKYSITLEIKSLLFVFAFLIVLLSIYLIASYFLIKKEKGFNILFINKLRREWMKYFLNKSLFSLKHFDKGSLLTKISYHFALLQMGITNSFFGVFQFFLLSISIVVASFFIDTSLLILSLIMIPVNILVFLISFFISKYYVSQEQTLYSKILRYISNVLDEFSIIKLNHKEEPVLKHIDEMVELDSYFRVRREIWMKFGYTIIFIALALFSASIYLVEIYFPFLEIEYTGQYIVYAIVFGLLMQLLYISLRVGLYGFPFILGLCLSVSDRFPIIKKKENIIKSFKDITFQSKKTKLSSDSHYAKDLQYTFSKGERILFTGKEGSGKTNLGYIFAGIASDDRSRPWIVKVHNERLMYSQWKRRMKDLYIIDPNFQTELTLFETFTKNALYEQSTALELENILNVLIEKPELSFLFRHSKALGKSMNKREFSFVERSLLQMAYCLYNKPSILVIDNIWLDMNHNHVNTLLKLLDKELKDTIIIAFSNTDNTIIEYDKKYTL